MTVVADNKHRVTLRNAKPGDRFDVQLAPDGRVILTRLVEAQSETEVVKPVRHKGLLVIPGEVDEAALNEQIREAREARVAGLLG
jgi:hypothetical protein